MKLQQILIERYESIMDNKSGSLLRVQAVKRISKSTNKEYYVLVTTWNMPGDTPEYNCELFISAEQYTLISMSKPLEKNSAF